MSLATTLLSTSLLFLYLLVYVESSCSPGSFNSTKSLLCESCTYGKYSPGGNLTSCIDCPRGNYNNQTASSNCTVCPFLSSTDNPGDRECSYCIAGKFYKVSNERLNFTSLSFGTCDICPKGTFSSVNSTSCNMCPTYTTTNIVLGESVQDCTSCVDGFYGNLSITINNDSCQPCVIGNGISCPEGSVLPVLAAGYFRNPNNVTFGYTCIPSAACAETKEQLVTACNEGYSGFVCGLCSSGYYRIDYFCKPCLDQSLGGFLLFVLVSICLLVVYKVLKEPDRLNIELRISLQAIQILGLYSNISTKWPSVLLVILQIASLSNVNIELFGPECFSNISYWDKHFLKVSLPLCFLLAFPLYGAVRLFFYKRFGKGPPEDLDSFYKRNATIAVFFIVSLYTLAVSASFQPLNCIAQSDGSYLMARNPSQFCYTDEWYNSFGGVIFFIVLYAGIVPFALAYFFWRNRRKLDSPEFAALYDVLIKPYRRGCYWWELVNMIRKAAFIIVIDFLDFENSRFTIYYIALCTLFLFLWIDIASSPYATREYNKFSLTWNMVAILVLICQGLIFERELVSESVTDGFQAMLIIALLGLIVYTVYIFLRRKLKGEAHVIVNLSALNNLNPQTVHSIYYLNSMLELEKSGVLEISMHALNSRMSYEHRMEVFKALDNLEQASGGLNATLSPGSVLAGRASQIGENNDEIALSPARTSAISNPGQQQVRMPSNTTPKPRAIAF